MTVTTAASTDTPLARRAALTNLNCSSNGWYNAFQSGQSKEPLARQLSHCRPPLPVLADEDEPARDFWPGAGETDRARTAPGRDAAALPNLPDVVVLEELRATLRA